MQSKLKKITDIHTFFITIDFVRIIEARITQMKAILKVSFHCTIQEFNEMVGIRRSQTIKLMLLHATCTIRLRLTPNQVLMYSTPVS